MPTHTTSRAALASAALLLPAGALRAQAPVVTGMVPLANARAASATAPVTVSFSQPLTAASGAALKVFSAQRGGLRSRGATPATVSGSSLSFSPATFPFVPGETVQYTVTTAAASAGGSLARPRVGQFTVAAGAGPGTLAGGSQLTSQSRQPLGVALGDVDGDGDLDLALACNSTNAVQLFRNSGSGGFGSFGSTVLALDNLTDVDLADVDGDGDLDLAVTCHDTYSTQGKVCIRLNNGQGGFSTAAGQNVPVGYWPTNTVLGDVDGDGDLDLVAVTSLVPGTVSVSLNNGSGVFGSSQDVVVANGNSAATGLALGDVDGDGDLDLLTANTVSGTGLLNVRLNDGNGSFAGSQAVAVGTRPQNLTLGDVDGDGDLDALTANTGSNNVSLQLNDGAGNLTAAPAISVGSSPFNLALGDVDGDGDLDLLSVSSLTNGKLSVRLNDGSGSFAGTQEVTVGLAPQALALGDVDGDGDLDAATANRENSSASVQLNQQVLAATAATPETAGWTLYPNPARGAVAITAAAPWSQVEVLDELGRCLLRAPTDAHGQAVLQLSPGLYAVRLGSQVRRLVVE